MTTKIIHLNNGENFTFVGKAAEKISELILLDENGVISFEREKNSWAEGSWFHVPIRSISYIEIEVKSD